MLEREIGKTVEIKAASSIESAGLDGRNDNNLVVEATHPIESANLGRVNIVVPNMTEEMGAAQANQTSSRKVGKRRAKTINDLRAYMTAMEEKETERKGDAAGHFMVSNCSHNTRQHHRRARESAQICHTLVPHNRDYLPFKQSAATCRDRRQAVHGRVRPACHCIRRCGHRRVPQGEHEPIRAAPRTPTARRAARRTSTCRRRAR